MSKSKSSQISEFGLSGRFLGFIVTDGYKLKHIRLATSEGEQTLKLAKSLRASIKEVLQPGDWLEVKGEKEEDPAKGKIKLKAYSLEKTNPLSPSSTLSESANNLVSRDKITDAKPQTKTSQVTVLICQKSDCIKRGSAKVCQAFIAEIGDRGLENQVNVKSTGCLKRCKEGPNLVLMPNKSRYNHVHVAQVSKIVEAVSNSNHL